MENGEHPQFDTYALLLNMLLFQKPHSHTNVPMWTTKILCFQNFSKSKSSKAKINVRQRTLVQSYKICIAQYVVFKVLLQLVHDAYIDILKKI